MRLLCLLFAIFLFFCQAFPGNAQAPPDTLECVRNGGSCNSQPCRLPSQPTGGTCHNGLLNCCKW
ncbi:gallinacin-9-like [Eublepharis macularius]|uniref:Gallinacin-9-like n=1 Tax=Eublepharis macularius TaxID=481883 RepID=A0AA97KSF1_EUBMA|nr:gallinacin-9-like [Eublepharis macularius]